MRLGEGADLGDVVALDAVERRLRVQQCGDGLRERGLGLPLAGGDHLGLHLPHAGRGVASLFMPSFLH